MKENSTTLDGILDRRVILEQPTLGYRVAMDTVLLAAAVPAAAGDRVLDLGCGVGGAFLSLACRVAGLTGIGIEIQSDLVDVCRRNIERNAFAKGFKVHQGDVTQLPSDYQGSFDHVVMNPPYHDSQSHDVSPNAIKRTANTEAEGAFALWVAASALALKSSGTLTLIHRADRRDEILAYLKNSFGQVEIISLLPKQDAEPKRIIIRARKNTDLVIKECQPLILHKEDGGYTDEAEAILRHGKNLP